MLVGCAWLSQRIDWGAARAVLLAADPRFVIGAVVLRALIPVCQVRRFMRILAHEPRIPTLSALGCFLIGDAAATFVPGRFGEVTWIWLLSTRFGVAPVVNVAALLVDKVYEALVLALVGALSLWSLDLPESSARVLQYALIAATLATGGALALARSGGVKRVLRRWPTLDGVERTLQVLQAPGPVLACLAWSVAERLAHLGTILLLFHATGIDLPVEAAGLVIVSQVLAMVLPLTPAQAGVFELSSAAPLLLLGASEDAVLAFTVLLRLTQLLPPSVGAVLGVRVLAARRRDV